MAQALKDRYFQKPFLQALEQALDTIVPAKQPGAFVEEISAPPWPDLALKARMHHLADHLRQRLAPHFEDAVEQLYQISQRLPQTVDSLEAMIFSEFVGRHGREHWQTSMTAMARFTSLGSAEFAVREFIVLDQERGFQQLHQWARADNLHLRRLASEGCRPRLPWSFDLPNLKRDPSPILPILETLKADPEIYVRKSVANNLNDISKDHPQQVLALAADWLEGRPHEHTRWIVKQGLRTLLKKGNPTALQYFGFTKPDGVSVDAVTPPAAVHVGQTVHFCFELVLEAVADAKKLRLEFAIDYLKANGKTSRKVFQIKEAVFEPGRHPIRFSKAFHNMTTRRHYPGRHHLHILVNGERLGGADFDLLA